MTVKLVMALILIGILGFIGIKISDTAKLQNIPSPSPSATPSNTPAPTPSNPTPTPTATPITSTKPQPSPKQDMISFNLGERVDLTLGQTVKLSNTNILVTLMLVAQPSTDCYDCPVKATLRVSQNQESTDLQYSFSG